MMQPACRSTVLFAAVFLSTVRLCSCSFLLLRGLELELFECSFSLSFQNLSNRLYFQLALELDNAVENRLGLQPGVDRRVWV